VKLIEYGNATSDHATFAINRAPFTVRVTD
jgi:hypothetical protein